jgi:hypothetical protein
MRFFIGTNHVLQGSMDTSRNNKVTKKHRQPFGLYYLARAAAPNPKLAMEPHYSKAFVCCVKRGVKI